jgi:hypothetical protein
MSFGPLFTPVVPSERFHPNFALLRREPGSEPTRLMMDEIFSSMGPTDGNFIEQFQTTGFDARVFELFLHAYFTSIGAQIARTAERPDYLLTRGSLTVAVEATTANPTQVPNQASAPITGVDLEALVGEETTARVERANHEVAIRFGSALFSKLRKHYWELPHVAGRPLVFAIEGFHAHDALTFSSASLAQYLYGIRQTGEHDAGGRLVISAEAVDEHQFGEKTIPSHFFAQPGAEHVSAVLFTNAGTVGKFTRMGYQAGLHRGNVIVRRRGVAWTPNPNAAEPTPFAYRLDEGPGNEPWGSGVEVFHNPRALHFIPDDFFTHAIQTRLKDGHPVSWTPQFAPFTSFTERFHLQLESLRPASDTPDGFGTILRREFEARRIADRPDFDALDLRVDEVAWFGEHQHRVVGVVLRWHEEERYDFVVLVPDQDNLWRYANSDTDMPSLDAAAKRVLQVMREWAATHDA